MKILVINCGSSSIKYQLINTENKECLCKGLVERLGAVTSIIKQEFKDEKPLKKSMVIENHAAALKKIMELLLEADNDYLQSLDEIEAVGHRVVHGGETFKDSVLIDEEVEEAIQQAFDIAPLHNPPNLEGIRAAKKHLPNVPHVAVFDTAFHHSIPQHAYLYGIPNRLYRRYKIRKYGFHGTSHYYVSRQYHKISGLAKEGSKVITCHLGNGCSVTAIKDGKSYDTSMGFSPLEGLVMGTRSGDIDPSILFYLIEKEELSLANVHALLNKHSGLLGLSGYAADMRDLLDEAESGDRRCNEAIDVFCYRVKKYIGSYIASLNGVDAIIFTGGIGENAAPIRSKILEDMEYAGISIDKTFNQNLEGKTKISTEDSNTEVHVIPTNEELVIAIDAAKIATASKQTPWA
ncbi:MAG: acetate kinase [Balneola sp.]|jgi:acetate kinase|nr:acetate kinase [Balneola sp.]MBE79533.1 acetate kinase [Balneola sp.]HBX65084.1 acetate kinase [Balneolaceae bacterium]|tara:strand:+ start:922 stop:2139 length:1218 start_codon:yes stop_codon:yes gene_type:complete